MASDRSKGWSCQTIPGETLELELSWEDWFRAADQGFVSTDARILKTNGRAPGDQTGSDRGETACRAGLGPVFNRTLVLASEALP